MSIGSWDPSANTPATGIQLDDALIARLTGFSSDDQLSRLEQLLEPDESQRLAALMKIDHGRWSDAAALLAEDQLLHLIRFFAVAENLPGWEAGPQSPVIPLCKALRKKGVRLDKTQLQWLREVNDNRFLPYGPL